MLLLPLHLSRPVLVDIDLRRVVTSQKVDQRVPHDDAIAGYLRNSHSSRHLEYRVFDAPRRRVARSRAVRSLLTGESRAIWTGGLGAGRYSALARTVTGREGELRFEVPVAAGELRFEIPLR